jgi:hypothetical protein
MQATMVKSGGCTPLHEQANYAAVWQFPSCGEAGELIYCSGALQLHQRSLVLIPLVLSQLCM